MTRNEKEKAVIIGSGLGGLECGYILARSGYEVTVLEQAAVPGGCMQSYKRGGLSFDTGFHYVGGLNEGGSLRWLAEYFNLTDLPWEKLESECSEELIIGSSTYHIPSGHDNYINYLSSLFPHEREGIIKFVSTLKNIGDSIQMLLDEGHYAELFGISAYSFLCECIKDERLRAIIAGASMRMDTDFNTIPLYVFGQIHNSFIQSIWRLKGGGETIVNRLIEDINMLGGEVVTSARVTRVKEDFGRIASVITEDGREYEADIVISDIHPVALLDILNGSESISKLFRQRINRLKESHGAFTVSIKLKPDTIPYVKHSIHIHKSFSSVWHRDNDRIESMMLSFGVPEDGNYATTLDLIIPSRCEEWEDYGGTVGHREEGYNLRKEELARECIALAETRIHGLSDAIERYWTSTPLTYRDYTMSPKGSAFGIKKDFHNPLATMISPRTPISNLLMTGQSLNLHGVLGVSATSLITCANVIGKEKIKREFGI